MQDNQDQLNVKDITPLPEAISKLYGLLTPSATIAFAISAKQVKEAMELQQVIELKLKEESSQPVQYGQHDHSSVVHSLGQSLKHLHLQTRCHEACHSEVEVLRQLIKSKLPDDDELLARIDDLFPCEKLEQDIPVESIDPSLVAIPLHVNIAEVDSSKNTQELDSAADVSSEQQSSAMVAESPQQKEDDFDEAVEPVFEQTMDSSNADERVFEGEPATEVPQNADVGKVTDSPESEPEQLNVIHNDTGVNQTSEEVNLSGEKDLQNEEEYQPVEQKAYFSDDVVKDDNELVSTLAAPKSEDAEKTFEDDFVHDKKPAAEVQANQPTDTGHVDQIAEDEQIPEASSLKPIEEVPHDDEPVALQEADEAFGSSELAQPTKESENPFDDSAAIDDKNQSRKPSNVQRANAMPVYQDSAVAQAQQESSQAEHPNFLKIVKNDHVEPQDSSFIEAAQYPAEPDSAKESLLNQQDQDHKERDLVQPSPKAEDQSAVATDQTSDVVAQPEQPKVNADDDGVVASPLQGSEALQADNKLQSIPYIETPDFDTGMTELDENEAIAKGTQDESQNHQYTDSDNQIPKAENNATGEPFEETSAVEITDPLEHQLGDFQQEPESFLQTAESQAPQNEALTHQAEPEAVQTLQSEKDEDQSSALSVQEKEKSLEQADTVSEQKLDNPWFKKGGAQVVKEAIQAKQDSDKPQIDSQDLQQSQDQETVPLIGQDEFSEAFDQKQIDIMHDDIVGVDEPDSQNFHSLSDNLGEPDEEVSIENVTRSGSFAEAASDAPWSQKFDEQSYQPTAQDEKDTEQKVEQDNDVVIDELKDWNPVQKEEVVENNGSVLSNAAEVNEDEDKELFSDAPDSTINNQKRFDALLTQESNVVQEKVEPSTEIDQEKLSEDSVETAALTSKSDEIVHDQPKPSFWDKLFGRRTSQEPLKDDENTLTPFTSEVAVKQQASPEQTEPVDPESLVSQQDEHLSNESDIRNSEQPQEELATDSSQNNNAFISLENNENEATKESTESGTGNVLPDPVDNDKQDEFFKNEAAEPESYTKEVQKELLDESAKKDDDLERHGTEGLQNATTNDHENSFLEAQESGDAIKPLEKQPSFWERVFGSRGSQEASEADRNILKATDADNDDQAVDESVDQTKAVSDTTQEQPTLYSPASNQPFKDDYQDISMQQTIIQDGNSLSPEEQDSSHEQNTNQNQKLPSSVTNNENKAMSKADNPWFKKTGAQVVKDSLVEQPSKSNEPVQSSGADEISSKEMDTSEEEFDFRSKPDEGSPVASGKDSDKVSEKNYTSREPAALEEQVIQPVYTQDDLNDSTGQSESVSGQPFKQLSFSAETDKNPFAVLASEFAESRKSSQNSLVGDNSQISRQPDLENSDKLQQDITNSPYNEKVTNEQGESSENVTHGPDNTEDKSWADTPVDEKPDENFYQQQIWAESPSTVQKVDEDLASNKASAGSTLEKGDSRLDNSSQDSAVLPAYELTSAASDHSFIVHDIVPTNSEPANDDQLVASYNEQHLSGPILSSDAEQSDTVPETKKSLSQLMQEIEKSNSLIDMKVDQPQILSSHDLIHEQEIARGKQDDFTAADVTSSEPNLTDSSEQKKVAASNSLSPEQQVRLQSIDNVLDECLDLVREDGNATQAALERDNANQGSIKEPATQPSATALTQDQLNEVLNNPFIPDSVKDSIRIMASQVPEKERDAASYEAEIAALKKENKELKEINLAKEQQIQQLSQDNKDVIEFAESMEDQNNNLLKANADTMVDNQKLKASLQDIRAQLENLKDTATVDGLPVTAAEKHQLLDMEALNLIGRLKKIWKSLMVLYLEDDHLPEIQSITEVNFILDQIEISIQIVASHCDGIKV